MSFQLQVRHPTGFRASVASTLLAEKLPPQLIQRLEADRTIVIMADMEEREKIMADYRNKIREHMEMEAKYVSQHALPH